MKNFLVISLSFIFISTASAASDCHQFYNAQINKLNSIIIPSRGGVLNTISSQAVAVPILAAAGLLTPAGLIGTGAVVVGTGSVYLVVSQKIKSLKKVLNYYEHHNDKNLKLVKKIEKKLKKRGIDSYSFNEYLIRGMDSGEFCEFNYDKNKRVLPGIKKIMKKYKKEFSEG